MTVLHEFSLTASPIGFIPKDYPRLTDLCYRAHIRYNDHPVEGGVYRDWRIVADAEPAKNKKGMEVGSSSKNHMKFQLLLDLIQHKNPTMSRVQILDCSIGNEWNQYGAISYADFNNTLADLGVRGYARLTQKKSDVENVADSFNAPSW